MLLAALSVKLIKLLKNGVSSNGRGCAKCITSRLSARVRFDPPSLGQILGFTPFREDFLSPTEELGKIREPKRISIRAGNAIAVMKIKCRLAKVPSSKSARRRVITVH